MSVAGFWLLAGAMLALAMALVALPLWRGGHTRDERDADRNLAAYRRQLSELTQERADGVITDAAYAESRQELERRLLDDVDAAPPAGRFAAARTPAGHRAAAACAVAVAVAGITLGVYSQVGSGPGFATALTADAGTVPAEALAAARDRLLATVDHDPEDAVAWHMLGMIHARLGDLDDADKALRRTLALRGDDPQVLTELARILALQRTERSFRGEPRALLERALDADPEHPDALWLTGLAAAEAGDMTTASRRWQALMALEDSEQAQRLREALRRMQARRGDDAEGGALPPLPEIDR